MFEPPHDKTNKMACAPSEASAESSLSACRKFGPVATTKAHSEEFDQADLSLRWAHSHFVGFVMRPLVCVLWCLGQDVEFDCIDSYCLFIYLFKYVHIDLQLGTLE